MTKTDVDRARATVQTTLDTYGYNSDEFTEAIRALMAAEDAYRESLITPTTQPLIDAVKAHALAHYQDGGWDVIVETYDDGMIAEQIGKARTPAGAIRKFAPLVDVWADRQADAINSAF
jgi:hypothetical protein